MRAFSTSRRVILAALLTVPLFMAWAGEPGKIVISHRGASGYLPEHTLPAKALAYGLGVDYIEQDVVLTRDNVPVVMHDIYLDATTDVKRLFPARARADGRWYVIDFTLAEVKSLSVNERVNPANDKAVFPGRFPLGKSHFEVPTLAEEIEMIQGLNKSTGRNVGIYPEIKGSAFHLKEGHDIDRIVVDLLASYGYDSADDRIFLQSFEPDCLKRIRGEFGSKLPLVQLISVGGYFTAMVSPKGMDEIATYANGIGPTTGLIVDRNGKAVNDNWLVKAAHERGLVVHPYVFRADALPPYAKSADEDIELFYFTFGVDGLFTDFTDIGVRVLKKRGLR